MPTTLFKPPGRKTPRPDSFNEAAVSPPTHQHPTSVPGGGLSVFVFSVTVFVSASLLFLVQPMVAKMLLPQLGGTPAVWNTCMVFFQAILLVGYAYVHVTTRWFGATRQAIAHVVVLLLPLLVLPIALNGLTAPAADAAPVWWLLRSLFVGVGLPLFVVSTSAPLMQKWFSATGHRSAGDPYFLYAASNVGSLLALLGYPLVVERWLPLSAQSQLWMVGYWLFAALALLCATRLWFRRTRVEAVKNSENTWPGDHGQTSTALNTPCARRRFLWVFAAFVPSSLMLGVTTHITSNLAPVPLLWVLPLSIYLLTFVLVFSRRRLVPHAWMVRLLPFLVLPLSFVTIIELPTNGWIAVVAHLVTFFVASMVCHGSLADTRPNAAHLTEFYLWISIGGVLGGLFNALVAPAVFNAIAEYPIALVLACFMLPAARALTHDKDERRRDLLRPIGLAVFATVLLLVVSIGDWGDSLGMRLVVFGPLGLICFGFKDRPVRFTLGLAVFVAALPIYCQMHRGRDLYCSRNFFGVKRVSLDPTGRFNVLVHGTTTHGKQFVDPARRGEPLTYYHRTGPLGDVFSARNVDPSLRHIAAIGLGAGSVASYVRPDESITFFEIDPAIEAVARDPVFFTFLSACRGREEVVIGDGRLAIARQPDHRFGLIILDAFSSDAIPTHMLTREALRVYVDKLAPGGVIAVHISNRYLHLAPVVASLARDANLAGLIRTDTHLTAEEKADGKTPSMWVALARDKRALTGLSRRPGWRPLDLVPAVPVWTDQYTSLLSCLAARAEQR